MAASAAGQPHLRLVGANPSALADWPSREMVEQAIATENRRAAANPELQPSDPRWVLAVRAYSQLQGSTLTPDRRQRVLQTAQQLGVRPFDANIIIAIVQDQARSGRALRDAVPTLRLLSSTTETSGRPSAATRWLSAIVAAALANLLLMWWLLSSSA